MDLFKDFESTEWVFREAISRIKQQKHLNRENNPEYMFMDKDETAYNECIAILEEYLDGIPKTFSFGVALALMREGYKVRCVEWRIEEYVLLKNNNFFKYEQGIDGAWDRNRGQRCPGNNLSQWELYND